MRILKLVAAVGLLMSIAACAVYTRDYAYDRYYYGPPVAYAYRY